MIAEIGVSYFSNRFLKHFLRDLKSLKKDGFNAILHTFSEEDFLYNPDTVKDMVKASKDYGFTVWIDPWSVGKVFGGEALSNFLLQNLDSWQIVSDGSKFPIACINSKKFFNFMKEWIDYALSMEIDAIFWDEPHFAVKNWHDILKYNAEPIWGCRCETCQKKYEKMFHKKMPKKLDETVDKFRNKSIKEFINNLTKYVRKKAGKKIKISTCLISLEPPEEKDTMATGISFENIASIKEIDSIGTDPYWFFIPKKINVYQHNYKFAKHIVEVARKYKKEPHFWVQGFGAKKGREEEILDAIKAAKDNNINSIWVWAYDGGSMMSRLASEDPEKTWKTIVKGMKKYYG